MNSNFCYQKSNYDCAPTCYMNALHFFFVRDEFPLECLNFIYKYTLDDFNHTQTIPGMCGTSKEAMKFITNKIKKLKAINKKKIKIKYVTGKKVNYYALKKEFKENQVCAIWRTKLENDHYVLITKIDKQFIYLFDPYKMPKNDVVFNHNIIFEESENYNRKINKNYFKKRKNDNFMLGKTEKRELIILKRLN